MALTGNASCPDILRLEVKRPLIASLTLRRKEQHRYRSVLNTWVSFLGFFACSEMFKARYNCGDRRKLAIAVCISFIRVTDLCRETVHYELRDRGIRVVTGRNLDDDGSQSNGAGKSVLVMAPLWALTGRSDARAEVRNPLQKLACRAWIFNEELTLLACVLSFKHAC